MAGSGVGASGRCQHAPRTCSAAGPPPAAAAGRGGTGTEVLRWAERVLLQKASSRFLV